MRGLLPRSAIILRDRREFLKLTQQEVADEVGMMVRNYQRFELGDRDFRRCIVTQALKICAALGLDPFEVVFEDASAIL